MNKLKVYSALVVVIITRGALCVPVHAQEIYSLQELYNFADQNSQKIRVSQIELQAANEGVDAAKTALLPNVEFNLQGSYTGNAFMLSRNFSTNGTTDYIVPGVGVIPIENGKQDTPHWGNSFSAHVSQVIYAGGAILSGIKMAELGKKFAELDVEKSRQEIRFLITGYYLDLCKLNNQIEVVSKNIELAQKVLKQMSARREQGTVLRNDITRYELQLQNLELSLSKLIDATQIINHQLVTTLHLPNETIIKCPSEMLESEFEAVKNISSQGLWQQTAKENNIVIRQAEIASDFANQKVRIAKSESLPSVAVVAENHFFGPFTQDLIPKDCNVNVWYIGLGLKYNLSSLWKNNHSIRKVRYEHKSSNEQLSLAIEGIENGIQANYVNFLTSLSEVKTQEKQVELANENYSIIQNRYQNNLALLTDMLDASNMKLSADMALVNAKITMLYNYYKLRYISNTL